MSGATLRVPSAVLAFPGPSANAMALPEGAVTANADGLSRLDS